MLIDYKCPNCGGTVKNGTCEYCGSRFIKENEPVLFPYLVTKPCRVFVKGIEVPWEMMQYRGEQETAEYCIGEIARSLADAIAPMLTIETEPIVERRTQRIVGRIRVVEPDYRF